MERKRVNMFCGKGGVGKTTCAAATALYHANSGARTLIISTDPTPSLHDIFEVDFSDKPTMITDNLYMDEVGIDEVKKMWDERFGAEVYDVFSSFVDIGYDEFVDFIASVLPGIRDEFMVDHIREIYESGQYDRVVWDTAPAGQTLGLLRMPSIVNAHLKPAPRIYSALKTTGAGRRSVNKVIRGWEELSNKDIEFLRSNVEFNLVTIAEALAVRQLDSICKELQDYGLVIDSVIVNQVVAEPDSDFLRDRAKMQEHYISEITDRYNGRQQVLALFPHEIKGIVRLEKVVDALFGDG
jgi:arsenite-transporting ATPase